MVRHRTIRTKGALSQDTARLMVFKLVMAAAMTWRRLKGDNQLPKSLPPDLIRGSSRVSPSATVSRSPQRQSRPPPNQAVTQISA